MKQVAQPIIPNEIENLTLAELSDGLSIEASRLENLQFSNIVSKVISFEGVELDACEVSSSKLRKASFTDVRFNNCILFASDFDGSGWLRVEVKHGIMSGIVLSDTALKDVYFKDAKANLSNFRFSKMQRVTFDGCDLAEADFAGAEMKNVVFTGCNLQKADFSNCSMSNVDLRNSKLTDIKGLQGLKGAVLSSAQLFELAGELANELGIRISDE